MASWLPVAAGAGHFESIFDLLLQFGTLNIQLGEDLVQPGGHPPGGVATEEHCRWDEGHADEEGVEKHAGAEGKPENLNKRNGLANEGHKHRNHNHGSGGHHAGALGETMNDRRLGAVVIALTFAVRMRVMFPHGGHEKHLVVHG